MRKFAFLPGALMIVAAVLWAAFALRWSVPAAVLGGGGVLALAVGVAANWKGVREWFDDPRGVFALDTLISTLLLVAALGLVNTLAGLHGATFDWTEAGRNTLAPETVSLVGSLGTDVVMKRMGRSRDAAARDLPVAFAALSPRLRVEDVDIDALPAEARRYGVTRAGSVVVEAERRFRRVDAVTEPALATAILQVSAAQAPRVCFAAGEGGHGLADAGSQGLSGLASVLSASNYDLAPVSLVIAGAPSGLRPDVLARVDRYLVNGGRLLLAVDPPVDPAVASFVARFGITVGQGVIIETSDAGRAVGAGPENPISFVYHDHPVTRGFDERTIFGRAVPLGVGPTEIGDPKPLASTAGSAFERVDLSSEATAFREGRDRRGPFDLAVATSVPRGSRDAALPEPRIVVTGDSDFLANGLLTWTANRDLAVRIIAWLCGVEEARVVAVSERQNRRVQLTERRRRWMYVVNLGVLPLLPLVAWLVVRAADGVRSGTRRSTPRSTGNRP
jgi:gliding motility-associatede transport system auxiliary component